MKRIIIALFALFALASPALAANSSVPAMGNSTSVVSTDTFYCIQSSGTVEHNCPASQVAALIYTTMSGDATVNAAGAITFATVNANVGSFGSATACTSFTVNAKGLITAASSATCVPAIGSVTGLGAGVATALAIAPGSAGAFVTFGGAGGTPSSITLTNGTGLPFTGVTGRFALSQAPQGIANSIWINPTGSTADMQNVAVPACANDGAHALVYINGTGLQCAAITGSGVSFANPTATAGPAANNGVATTAMRSDASPAVQSASNSQKGLVQCDGTTIVCPSGTATAVPGVTSRTVSGATDTILSTDRGNVVYYNSASSIAVSQPAPSGAFAAGFFTTLCQINVGVPTVTPGSGTIDGGATYALPAGTAASPSCISYQSDGTNFNAVDLQASFGSNVQAALGKALSAAGGVTSTIFHGTAVLGTSAIASGACATVVTVTAANVATTDVVSASYNGDPTAVTGYGASATGAVLSIYPYPTSGNILVKVCNSTSGSITPGAMTLNVSAVR